MRVLAVQIGRSVFKSVGQGPIQAIAHGHGVGFCKNGGVLRNYPLHGLQGLCIGCPPAQTILNARWLRQLQHMPESKAYTVGPAALIAHKNNDSSGNGNNACPLGGALPKAGKAANNHEPTQKDDKADSTGKLRSHGHSAESLRNVSFRHRNKQDYAQAQKQGWHYGCHAFHWWGAITAYNEESGNAAKNKKKTVAFVMQVANQSAQESAFVFKKASVKNLLENVQLLRRKCRGGFDGT